MAKTRVMYDWINGRELLEELTRQLGPENVMKAVEDEAKNITRTENQLKLPDGFRFFCREDWYAFAGATKFVDGVRPVIGEIKLSGVKDDGLVIMAAEEDGKEKANVQITIGEDDQEIWMKIYDGKLSALADLRQLTKSTPSLADLAEAGWEKIV